MTETWLTIEEAAAALRISVSTLQHAMARREVGFTRLGRRCYFAPEDLAAYLRRRRVDPLPASETGKYLSRAPAATGRRTA